jgi:predicted RNA-binding protein with PIN domain
MRWLIDGYNVIRRDPDLRGAESESLSSGRAALLGRLAAVARDRPEIFTVVFDGARLRADDLPAAAGGAVDVVFSRPPDTADDVLRRLATRWREAAVVVSSDRAVQTAAQRAGAVAVGVEDFLHALDGEAQDDEDDDGDEEPREKRGNPRRESREARAGRRALRRLARRD